MRSTFQVNTQQKVEIINITPQVQKAIDASGVGEEACTIYLCEFDGPRDRQV
ncbi:hypothetical protein [Egbenema bharatensis]|uniref:hypothetical protein n=1 Tax=Egbenema bharatensis TaxID=3463334 RepID=UPI003A857211